MGKGLGLNIADSFWFFSNNPHNKNQMTFFEGISSKRSDASRVITESIKNGRIDSLHTYGDFSCRGGFHRELAIQALKELKKEGLKITIWINHGENHNFQNVLIYPALGDIRSTTSRAGIETQTEEYHTDLLRGYGIKFFWNSHVTGIIGQDRECSLIEYYESLTKFNKSRRIALFFLALIANKTRIPFFLSTSKKAASYFDIPYIMNNDLLIQTKLRDGWIVYTFQRYGSYELDTEEDIPYHLSDKNLKKLIDKEGYMILYTHLGKKKTKQEKVLSGETVRCLKKAAKISKDGLIWIAPTSKLLFYNMLTKSINWKVTTKNKDSIIIIKKVDDEVFGKFNPSLSQLSGITFYTNDPKRTKISIRDKIIDNTSINPPDYLGRKSVTIK